MGLINSNFASGQPLEIHFENYTDENGLSSNSISCIMQDSKGFLWFGTEDGLNRFDGYTFKIYRKILDDTKSLGGNSIIQLFERSDGKFWIRFLDKTINLFDPATGESEQFKNYLPLGIPNNNIHQVFLDSHQQLWVIKSLGEVYLFSLKPGTGMQSNNMTWMVDSFYNPKYKGVFPNNSFADQMGNLWIRDWNMNMFYLTLSKKTIKEEIIHDFDVLKIDKNITPGQHLTAMFQDAQMHYWIGTQNGLILCNQLFQKIKDWSIPPGIRNQVLIKNNQVWIPTNNGLYKLNLSDSSIQQFSYESGKTDGLAFNMINCIFMDRQGILWIGTHNGLSKYDPLAKKIKCYRKEPYRNNGLKDNRIRSITADDSGRVWIGTDQFGLCSYNPKTGLYTDFSDQPGFPVEIGNKSIYNLLDDGPLLWIGTRNGLFTYNKHNGKVSQLLHDSIAENSLPDNYIKVLAKSCDTLLWIGTANGLSMYNLKNNVFKNFYFNEFNSLGITNTKNIRSILPDGFITWVGLEGGGLIKLTYQPNSGKYLTKHYFVNNQLQNGFGPNWINHICKTANGLLWLATYSGGLISFNPEKEIFSVYTTVEGLPNDIIYAILEDRRGNLWMSTNGGIARYSPDTKTFRNFGIKDGVQGNEFNSGAFFKSKNGEMFFGGTNGWNMFNPDSIRFNQFDQNIVFTDFQIFNKTITPLTSYLIKKDLNYITEITLPSAFSVFSFEFAALNFSNSIDNTYLYMMEGYDKSWQNLGKRRFITFTSMSPGDYVLKLSSLNNDGLKSPHIKKLQIHILPAYYQTLWFKLVIFLLTSGITGYAIYLFYRYAQVKKNEQFRIREQIKKDLHDDLKSDLAAIQSKTVMASKNLVRKEYDKSNIRMLEISELIQKALSTADDLSWAFNPKEDNIDDLFNRMKNFLVSIIPDHIHYKVSFPRESLKETISFKYRKHIYLIFKEGLYNVVKHSKCTQISISGSYEEKVLILIIEDNGIGFDYEQLKRQNGLQHMKERADEIKAELELISNSGKGTILKLKLSII